MKTEIKIQARSYLVQIKDARTGEKKEDRIVLTKEQLQAGAMFDLGEQDIICRIYNRQGFRVLEISKAYKRELTVDLHKLYHDAVFFGVLAGAPEVIRDSNSD